MKINKYILTLFVLPFLNIAMQKDADRPSSLLGHRRPTKRYARRSKQSSTETLSFQPTTVEPGMFETYETMEQKRGTKKRNAVRPPEEALNDEGPSKKSKEKVDYQSIYASLDSIEVTLFIKKIFLLLSVQYDLIFDIAEKKNLKVDPYIQERFLIRNFTQTPIDFKQAADEMVIDLKTIAGFIERFTLDYPKFTTDMLLNFPQIMAMNLNYLNGILKQ